MPFTFVSPGMSVKYPSIFDLQRHLSSLLTVGSLTIPSSRLPFFPIYSLWVGQSSLMGLLVLMGFRSPDTLKIKNKNWESGARMLGSLPWASIVFHATASLIHVTFIFLSTSICLSIIVYMHPYEILQLTDKFYSFSCESVDWQQRSCYHEENANTLKKYFSQWLV